MRWRQLGWLFLLAGFGLIGWFAYRVGLGRLGMAFRAAGWGILVLLALPIFLYVVHAAGWGFTLSPQNRRRLGLVRLTALQTFAYGISGMLPLQVFLAEPLKLAFLRGCDYDKEDFAASLIIDNTINGISIFAVSAAGLLYFALVLAAGPWVRLIVSGLVWATAALLVGLIVVQRRGLVTGVLGVLGRLPGLAAFRARHRPRARRIDDLVRRFYRERPGRFLLAFLLHVVEKAQGVAEFWVIFRVLGMDVSWGNCFFVFSVTSTLDNLLFFAQVGGMEAWVSSLLAWMNITRDSINVTAALFRRVRFLFWTLLSLLMVWPTRRLLRHGNGLATSVGVPLALSDNKKKGTGHCE